MACLAGCVVVPRSFSADPKEPPATDAYAATARQLVPGGVVYGIVDFADDAALLRRFLAEYAPPTQAESPWRDMFRFRLEPLVDLLGLSDVAAAGISSTVRADGLFDNRTFFYLPRGRHGLLGGLGGEPGAFTTASLAPSDVDLFYETQFDLARAYRAFRDGASEVLGLGAGEALDGFLDELLAPMGGVTMRDLIAHARGRLSIVVVIDGERTAFVDLEGPIKVPACDALLRIEGIGQTLTPLLDQVPVLELSIRDGRRHYAVVGRPWVSTWTPAVVIDRDVAYIGSSQAFILACIGREGGLAASPDFESAVAELGGHGDAITWISPRMVTLRRRVLELNEGSRSSHIKDLRNWLPSGDPSRVPVPLVSIRRNLADGILFRSRWDTSLKRDMVSATVLNPVTVALSGAILAPHYRRARERSQEIAIYGNLRRLQLHARQYCYDHKLTTVPIRTIMGDDPGKLVPNLKPVAGENYAELEFLENYPLRVMTEDGRVVEYGP